MTIYALCNIDSTSEIIPQNDHELIRYSCERTNKRFGKLIVEEIIRASDKVTTSVIRQLKQWSKITVIDSIDNIKISGDNISINVNSSSDLSIISANKEQNNK